MMPVVAALCRAEPTCRSRSTPRRPPWPAKPLAAGAEIDQRRDGPDRRPGDGRRWRSRPAAASCAMHMQGTPQTMQDDPTYDDVVAEVLDYLAGAPRRPGGRRHRPGADRPGPGHRLRQDDRAQPGAAGERRAVSRVGLPGAGRPLAQRRSSARCWAIPRPTAPPARSAWRWPWPGRACRSSASTTWRPSARPCCCSRRP